MSAANIKVEAMKVFYGEDKAQVEKIICHGDTALTPLNSRYFIMTIAGAKHAFWFNVASGGTAPTVPDATLHEVDIAALALAPAVATALEAVIEAVTGVTSTVSGNEIEVTHDAVGYQPSAVDALAGERTDFGFQILTQGETEAELGCVEGDIEVAFEESFAEVKCHDTGTTPIASLKTGVNNVEVTMSALETTKAQLKTLFVKTNGSFTPESGTEVFGMGTFKNFENMFKFASKLRLHPARLLPGDLSEDWTFHKAIPVLTGITFSGENPLTLPLTFKVYPDETKNARVNYFSIGDGSQSLG